MSEGGADVAGGRGTAGSDGAAPSESSCAVSTPESPALDIADVRIVLPGHLRNLAKVTGRLSVQVAQPVTIGAVLDAIETQFPVLRGAIRDHGAGPRRPFVRFFACEQDLSHDPMDTVLPDAVVTGAEPFLVVGAVAGG